ncbi:hypothetical protein TWF225_010764 [Orbilia oligospora]|uniref:Uncharacterized protein n=1 Tax=Orbilia oligospora TaxID=2813651 RepID=A0A8H2E5N3_ORBOL|nr:hypothetical protein TWF225_010764 [Orbilia oligospora]KAF3242539.1 hypothetical protein TWF128_010503 [Orbilia oligospora]KAF3253624.1 hypothetical protein TWF217_007408 [Orbilia oligospora]KAF3286535.1 hypothetical protein TWF132_008817 [Orbilia oligospora]TGJ72907.1 hypothetical protein EYR41_000031 [Orbilia oligospora]
MARPGFAEPRYEVDLKAQSEIVDHGAFKNEIVSHEPWSEAAVVKTSWVFHSRSERQSFGPKSKDKGRASGKDLITNWHSQCALY